MEAVTPLLGWCAGIAASSFVEAVDHWIAFGLLLGVGLHMIYSGLTGHEDSEPAGRSLYVLMATAIGTSLDAMAVGVSLAFLEANIITIAIAIGVATFIMSSGGMMLGRLIGARLGRIAECLGGVAVIALGFSILVRHISGA